MKLFQQLIMALIILATGVYINDDLIQRADIRQRIEKIESVIPPYYIINSCARCHIAHLKYKRGRR